MEIPEHKLRELLTEAFKEGQKTPNATEGIIKLWIAGEING